MGAEAIQSLQAFDLATESDDLPRPDRQWQGPEEDPRDQAPARESTPLPPDRQLAGRHGAEVVPVIPPELRPMVQLDGGRFATSDLPTTCTAE
jgi:DNA-directed RNA polymerase beta' subunit